MTDVHRIEFSLRVNDDVRTIECSTGDTLLDVLRDELGLTGAKFGCGIGYCGACTVLIDDDVAHACCLLAATMEGRSVRTVESLATNELDAVQQAFLDEGAVQCGYCTPGFVMSVRGLLEVTPEPTEEQAREFLAGNICRCSGFAAIVRAATATSKTVQP